MKIIYKLILGFLAVVSLGWLAVYLSIYTSQKELHNLITKETEILADEMIKEVDREVFYRIERWLSYAYSNPRLKKTIIASNLKFQRMPDRDAHIAKIDKDWKEGRKTGFIQGVLNNKLSKRLKQRLLYYNEKYRINLFPEVFVTNKYGAVIASSGRTSDYYQADEEWYQRTLAEERFWVGDIEYDKSAKSYANDVVIKLLDDDDGFIGLIKVVLNSGSIGSIVSSFNEEYKHSQKEHESAQINIITNNGRLIYSTAKHQVFTDLSGRYFPVFGDTHNSTHKTTAITNDAQHRHEKILFTHSHSEGYRDYRGLGWFLVIEHDTDEIFAPITSLKNQLLYISLLLTSLAIIVGVLISRSLSRPIANLRDAAVDLGKGKQDKRIQNSSHDEIGDLAKAFNSMAESLQTTTVSRDLLETEVEERRQAQEELQRSNSELQQFAYVASHDLQEPLRMVASYVQLLAKRYKGKLDQDADDFIDFAVDGATRMKSLINDLLQYSRVQTQGKDLQPTSTETVFEKAISNLQFAIEDSKAEITHDPLPTVMGDESQLIRLFQNLVGNAIKFRGEDPIQVHVSAEFARSHSKNQASQQYLFSVRDNGIGIDPEQKQRIFLIFQRLHGKDKYPGTGIGLAVSKRIVERHGGEIWVEPGEEKGSTFFFTLPASDYK